MRRCYFYEEAGGYISCLAAATGGRELNFRTLSASWPSKVLVKTNEQRTLEHAHGGPVCSWRRVTSLRLPWDNEPTVFDPSLSLYPFHLTAPCTPFEFCIQPYFHAMENPRFFETGDYYSSDGCFS